MRRVEMPELGTRQRSMQRQRQFCACFDGEAAALRTRDNQTSLFIEHTVARIAGPIFAARVSASCRDRERGVATCRVRGRIDCYVLNESLRCDQQLQGAEDAAVVGP